MKSVEELLKDPANWPEGFQTRDGRPVRILATDMQHPTYRVIGLVKNNDYESSGVWRACGAYVDNLSTFDLIPRPVKRKGWVNVYPNNSGSVVFIASDAHVTKEHADAAACKDRIACIQVEFTEGQGL